MKKKRSIYEITLSEIVAMNSEESFPEDLISAVTKSGEDISFATASIVDAYRIYMQHSADEFHGDFNYELLACEVEVTDKEWNELLKKGKLEYSDYKDYINAPRNKLLAWTFSYNGEIETENNLAEELLVVQSENYNMRVICSKAGVSYSTYRGFKNNNKRISSLKVLYLLRTMNQIGNACWNDDLEGLYKFQNSDEMKKRRKREKAKLTKKKETSMEVEL